jgi:energy-coupling factor transporter transmembrane protein EcfT
MGALAFLKELIFSEELAMRKGFLQSLDPRVKLVTFLWLIIQIVLTRSTSSLFFLYLFCLLLVLISKINLGYFLKRTWIFIPLFALLIAIPAAMYNLHSATIFVMRVLVCVSFAVLLSITTKHFELLGALRFFKVPQVFVMTLGICYRYIYLFVEMIQQIFQAIKSRVGALVHYKSGQKIVAWSMAALWLRCLKLNEEVYSAMLSRGYQGEAVAWNDFKIKTQDGLWLTIVVIIIWII